MNTAPPVRGAPPSATMPADNVYTAEAATQALAFKTRHPTFDGRGVVIGFVEPAAPNMSTMRGALDMAGKPVPKFSHYDLGKQLDANAAVIEATNIWQETESVTPDVRGRFRWMTRDYSLPSGLEPSATRWRICRRLPGGMLSGKEHYDLLWAVDAQKVWVLPGSLGFDFSAATSASLTDPVPWVALGDAVSRRSNPAAEHAFVFAADRERLWLASAVAQSAHAGMVASVMAGAHFLGGSASGIAPAAQLAIYDAYGFSTAAPNLTAIGQMLAMVSDPRVDIAQASVIVGDTSRFGGLAPHQLWIDRLIDTNGKPYIKGIGNYGARLYGSDEFSNSERVFAVGAYTPRDTWRANLGVTPAAEHTLPAYSGWGPADDGALKPDFLGVTHTLAEGIGYEWYWSDMPGHEEYTVSGGTSASAPNAAGHVALLVSAAKQSGIPYDAGRLRAVIASTARFFDNVEARAQGHGLIQVSDAWAALKRAAKWQPSLFRIQAPLVGAETKALGPDRGVGRGLFELSGWRPGQAGRRKVSITRTSGRPQDSHYRLRWKGDTQVFTSAWQHVELPLGKAVDVPIDIRTGATSGSSSAILDLIDPGMDLIASSILCTVIVSDALPANGALLSYERHAPRIGNTLFYVDVPPGLSALTVELDKDNTQGIWSAQDPTGSSAPFDLYGSETPFAWDVEAMKAAHRSLTYSNPAPGVWQFVMQLSQPQSLEDLHAVQDWSKPMPLRVRFRGWAAQAQPPAPLVTDNGHVRTIQLKHRGTDDKNAIRAVGLGAMRAVQVKLEPGLKPAFFDVVVDPGASRLEVNMAHAAQAQVGLYVYKLPEGERREKTLAGGADFTALMYRNPSHRFDKEYALVNPPPGRYRIALDPIAVPAAGLSVSYRDTVYHPVYGSVELGESDQAKVSVRARREEGRKLLAEVALFDGGDTKDQTVIVTEQWLVDP